MSGIEVESPILAIEKDYWEIKWDVKNNSDIQLVLFNTNNPVVEKKEDKLYLYFMLIDSSQNLILRETPFRSKTRKIDGNTTYSFYFSMDGTKKIESLDLSKFIDISDIENYSKIVVTLGYTYEDIYLLNSTDGEREVTGGEVIKVKVDNRVVDIRTLKQETLPQVEISNFINLLDI